MTEIITPTGIVQGFRIRQDVLDHLGPMERVWAQRLIEERIWHLVPATEVSA